MITETCRCQTVSFVIPAWNHYDLLMQCLHSLDGLSGCGAEADGTGVEVVIVDNGSDAAEKELLLKNKIWENRIVQTELPFDDFETSASTAPEEEHLSFSRKEWQVRPLSSGIHGAGTSLPSPNQMAVQSIRFIPLTENTGFSHAVNVGVSAASGELIILLNNDILLEMDFVTAVRRAMANHPDWLHAATKIRQFHHPERLDDAGNVVLPTGRAVKIGYGEPDGGQYGGDSCGRSSESSLRRHFVFSACGAAAVYRRSFFDKVGCFDEDFFAYLEDVDLGFRAQRMGLPCGWIPEAVSLHIGSATTGSMKNTFTVRLLARNQVSMLVKNLPGTLLFLLGFPIAATMMAQWLRYCLNRNGNGKAYFRGLVEGLSGMNSMRVKRRLAKADWQQPAGLLFKQMLLAGRMYRNSKANRIHD